MSFSVTKDDERAQALLQRLATIVANPRGALSQSAQALDRLVRNTFEDKRDPWGQAWARHAPATTAARDRTNASDQILIDTGAMFATLNATADESSVSVSVGTEYASYQQFGDPNHRAWGGPVSPLPARPFLPERAPGVVDIPAPWWYEILFPIEAAIDRACASA